MQGRLLGKDLEVLIETSCVHCEKRIELSVSSDLDCEVLSSGAGPFVFEPSIDWSTFKAPNIIHDY